MSVNLATEEDQTNKKERQAAGIFVRGVSTARNRIGDEGFEAEPNRYHLYVAYNCPWCHRVTLARALHGLEDSITMDVLFPNRTTKDDAPLEEGRWQFRPDGVDAPTGRHVSLPECTSDTVLGKALAKQVYEDSGVMDQTSVPILYDKKSKRVVNNESADMVRMLTEHAAALGGKTPRVLFPGNLKDEIEAIETWVYTDINNGSYKAGFSSNADTYEGAYTRYFQALERLEVQLAGHADSVWLLGGKEPTEADLRLFPTIYRHDPVYHARMKLSYATIREYPFLWRWLCAFHALPGVKESSRLSHCKQGYFGRNGNNTIPVGPPGYPLPMYATPAAAVGKDEWVKEPELRARELAEGLPRGWLSSHGQ
uniref:GST C-terminal domain-containing protein n=1 Tax=Hemiselmis andersenii TaxID=464988 RepID=A0A6U4NE14_HEMAN